MADQKPYALDRIVRVLISAGILAGVIWMILGLTGRVFVVVQIIQDTILVPKTMGKVTGLNPAMKMLSMSIWGKAARPFGDDHRFAGDLFAAGVLPANDSPRLTWDF